MDSRADGRRSEDNGKSCRSLSVPKKDKKLWSADKNKNQQCGPSITSFFKNIPPKLACPICGKFIPRFKVNEHIDSQCRDFLCENSVETCHIQREKTSPTSKTRLQNSNERKNASNQETTSPYFKKDNIAISESHVKNCKVEDVRKISLGGLSNKLSENYPKKGLRFPKDVDEGQSPVSSDTEPNCSEPSSSQKENFNENDDSGSEHQSRIAKTIHHLHAEGSQGSATNTQDIQVPQSGITTPSLKLLKRKKSDSHDKKQSGQKKLRLQKRSKNPVPNQTKPSCTSLTQITESLDSSCSGDLGYSKTEDLDSPQIAAHEERPATQQEVSELAAVSPRLPYYLRNFLTVLEAVLEHEDDRALFSEEDLAFIQSFEKLSGPGQMLYVRLFQRKLKWLQLSKLDYAEISPDLRPVVQELVKGGFLQSEVELCEIQDVLDLLPAPELRNLAKTFHLGGPGSSSSKQQLVEGLLSLSKQRSLFTLVPGQNNTSAVMLKRAKWLAGPCLRLSRDPRIVFSRLLLLFSLTDSMEEEEMASGGQGQLYTILLVNSGRLAFPTYTIQRSTQVFRSRDDLIRYEAAMRILQEVITAMQTGCWEDALVLYTSAKSDWQSLKNTCDLSWQEELPVFLRCFTAGWAYTRILSRGVEVLQRLKRYQDAVEELKSLLSQSVFCPSSRGRWWDRLALNLQQHLKHHEQAIGAIKDGLSDPLVRTGHRLALYQRAVRMKESASFKKYHHLLRDLPSIHVDDVPHVTIRGQLFPHEGGMGKSVFLRPTAGSDGSEEGHDDMVLCSVEELALAHYRDLGFDQGIHGEGSTFSTLFGLLMWDIIFMEGVPDVFRTSYQACPLDLHTDCFYESRKAAIEARSELLHEASIEILQALLAEVWNSQEGKTCALINWERFSSLQQAQSLVACLGGHFLSGVVLRMAKDYRHSRGGFPDLIVWNTSNNSCKLVEVKGPNDRLSQKQQLWLDELQKLGASVEVCHVTATGARGARLE